MLHHTKIPSVSTAMCEILLLSISTLNKTKIFKTQSNQFCTFPSMWYHISYVSCSCFIFCSALLSIAFVIYVLIKQQQWTTAKYCILCLWKAGAKLCVPEENSPILMLFITTAFNTKRY